MPVSYEELKDIGGTIYKGEKGYATPAELATDLGIKPHQIEWGKISKADTITGDTLKDVEPIDLGTPQEAVDTTSPYIAGLEEQQRQFQTRMEQQTKEREAARTDIEGTLAKIAGEGQEQLRMEEEAGIPGLRTELADIQGQIAVKTAEYRQLQAQEQQRIATMERYFAGEGAERIRGETDRINREFLAKKNSVAADSALLEAKSYALSGKISSAQASVDRMVSLKYDAYRAELDLRKFQLGLISEVLTASEQREWNTQQSILEAKKQEMEDAKAEDAQIQNLMITAAQAGATGDVLDDISNSSSVLEATQKASPYLVEEPELQTQVVEVGGRKQLINTQTGDVIRDLGVADVGVGAGVGGVGGIIPPEQEQVVLKSFIDELPVGQQDAAYSAIASFKNAEDILKLLDAGVQTGPYIGRVIEGFKIPFTETTIIPGRQAKGTSTQQENEFVSASTAFAANFIKSISGVAVSEQEYKRLMKALPDIKNQENVNRDNLKMLLSTIRNKYETQLGINFDQFPTAIPQVEQSLRNQVIQMGYDYDKLKADGHSDEEIRSSLGL